MQDLAPREVAVLYRHRTLQEAGVNTVVSSDAPYGPVNPWQVMDAASRRTTRSGVIIGDEERIHPDDSLRGYLLHAHGLQEPARGLTVGANADLCLLQQSWFEAKKQIAGVKVQTTIKSGILIYQSTSESLPGAVS